MERTSMTTLVISQRHVHNVHACQRFLWECEKLANVLYLEACFAKCISWPEKRWQPVQPDWFEGYIRWGPSTFHICIQAMHTLHSEKHSQKQHVSEPLLFWHHLHDYHDDVSLLFKLLVNSLEPCWSSESARMIKLLDRPNENMPCLHQGRQRSNYHKACRETGQAQFPHAAPRSSWPSSQHSTEVYNGLQYTTIELQCPKVRWNEETRQVSCQEWDIEYPWNQCLHMPAF